MPRPIESGIQSQRLLESSNRALVLTEEGDKTRLTTTVVFPSQAVRDEVVKSGMTKGAGDSYDHLERVLTEVGANL